MSAFPTTHSAIAAWLAHLDRPPVRHHQRRLTALSRFCAWAVAERIMVSDPTTHTKSLAPEPQPVVLRHGLYICQDERSFRAARHMAFYADGQIRYLFEIVGSPFNHCNPENMPLLAGIEGYEFEAAAHQVMHLGNMREIGPIHNDLTSQSGRRIAFTQGQRYTTLDKILAARSTSELIEP